MLIESKQEKRLRILLIIFFVSVTAVTFFFKYQEQELTSHEESPVAVVVQKASEKNQNPIVILYNYQQGQHILAQYEIQRNDNFHFKTIKAIKLDEAVDELILDKESGVWVKLSDQWHYLNKNLEVKKRAIDYKGVAKNIPYTEKVNGNNKWIVLEGDGTMKIDLNEIVQQVHALSNDNRLWLVVTNLGVKISSIETK